MSAESYRRAPFVRHTPAEYSYLQGLPQFKLQCAAPRYSAFSSVNTVRRVPPNTAVLRECGTSVYRAGVLACAVLACVLAPWAVLCLADLLLARWAIQKWRSA
jgi:hypothetical protein